MSGINLWFFGKLGNFLKIYDFLKFGDFEENLTFFGKNNEIFEMSLVDQLDDLCRNKKVDFIDVQRLVIMTNIFSHVYSIDWRNLRRRRRSPRPLGPNRRLDFFHFLRRSSVFSAPKRWIRALIWFLPNWSHIPGVGQKWSNMI